MANSPEQDWIVNEFARLVAARIGEPGQERFLALLRDECRQAVQEEMQKGQQRSEPRHAELLARMEKLEAALRPEPQAIANFDTRQPAYEAPSPWRVLLMPALLIVGIALGALATKYWFSKPIASPSVSTNSPSSAVPSSQDPLRAEFLKIRLEPNAGKSLGCSTTIGDCLKVYNVDVQNLEELGQSIDKLPDAAIRQPLTVLSIQALARAKLIPDMKVDGKISEKAEKQILDTGCSQRLSTQWRCLLDKSFGLR